MKATDLMIGDWVRHFNGTPMRVERIDRDAFACGIPHCWDYNNIYTPIPLTPEILEKNGFQWGYTSDEEDIQEQGQTTFEKGWVWDEGAGSVKVIFPEGTDGGEVLVDDQRFDKLLDFIWNETINVHELQHALRLCGIEKEIII